MRITIIIISTLIWIGCSSTIALRIEELKTFYCDHVRKMLLRGLDLSMPIRFLCHDEAD